MKHKILAMPVLRQVILVACLVLAGNLNLAQGQRVEYGINVNALTEEQKNRLNTTGLSQEEFQRLFEEGKAGVKVVDEPEFEVVGMDFDISLRNGEEYELIMERQRREEEMFRAMFDDVGVTEAEMEQFFVNMTGVVEPYEKYMEENSWLDNPTRENYVETAELFFNNFVQPVMNDIRSEAINFFSEDQYAKLTTRLYQFFDSGLASGGDDLNLELNLQAHKWFLLPDLVGLTEEQLIDFSQLQKEFFIETFGISVMVDEEFKDLTIELDLLNTQLSKAETEEERAAIKEQLKKVQGEINEVINKPSRELLARMQSKLDTLLTAGQKAKLAQIKADIPDYLRVALGGMKTGDAEESSAASGEWRPGPNSWVPGMGAPGINPNREAPRVRETQSGRSFPGGE